MTEGSFDDVPHPPSTRDIDRVLSFLPLFEDLTRRWYEVDNADDGALSHEPYRYDEEFIRFTSALHAAGFVVDFDWAEWQSVSDRF